MPSARLSPQEVAVLLINGRDPTAQRLACFLASQGLLVTAVPNIIAGHVEAQSRPYDCVVLDLGDVADAVVVTRDLRAECRSPIVFIASTRNLNERIEVLDAGADDCVAHPVSERELLSRILASVRRARGFQVNP